MNKIFTICSALSMLIEPALGQTIARLEITTKATELISPAGTDQIISLVQDGVETQIPVVLLRHVVEVKRYSKPQDTKPLMVSRMTQFEIRSKSKPDFSWSCWDDDGDSIKGFKIFPAGTGSTYAAYVGGDDVLVFTVTKPNEADAVDRLVKFLQGRQDADLTAELIVGYWLAIHQPNFDARDSLSYQFIVDNVYKNDGELRVIIHGNDEKLKYEFANKDGNWRILNPPGTPGLLPSETKPRYTMWAIIAVVVAALVVLVTWLSLPRRKKHKNNEN